MNRLDRAPVQEFRRSRFPGHRLLLLCAVVFLTGTTARTAQGTEVARQRARDAAPTIRAQPDAPAVVGDTLFSIDVEDIGAPPVDTQLGVEFALDYFWVTGRSSADNIKRLYKLNRSGQLVASFPQGTTSKFGWRDLAFDGTYLYASDENEFAKIDPNNGQKIGALPKPSGVTLLRGLAFDPARRHFWTSDFSGPLVEFDSTGTIINSFETPDSSAYGLAWDQWTTGGPYLWVWAQTGPRDGPFCTAIQVNPLTGKKTGIQFTGVDFQADTLNDLAGGATISHEIDPSRTVFVGLHQSVPDRVVVYDLTLLPPAVVSLPATDIARTSVTLGGTINPNNLPATVWFEWGTNSSLTVYDSVGTQFAGSGTKSVVATTSLAGLTSATTYYYRIAGMNGRGTTRGSILSFTTIANPPVVSSQAATGVTSVGAVLNGGVNPNGAITTAWFEWGTNSSLTTYDTVGTHSVGSGSSSVMVTTSLNGLLAGTGYYYRIVASNAAGVQKGGVLNFSTPNERPAVPILSSPPSGVENQPVIVTIRWHSSPGAERYHLQVAADSIFSLALINKNDSTIVDTVKQVGPLDNGMVFFWRVSATNAAGTSVFSPVWKFSTIVAPPSTPSLVAPANGAVGQPTALRLVWNKAPGSAQYRLQLSSNAGFTQLIIDDSSLVDTSRQIGSLSELATYYWRVSASNAGGSGGFSQIWNFVTTTAPPAPPQLVAPANAEQGLPLSVTLQWNGASGTQVYQVQVATDSLFTSFFVNDTSVGINVLNLQSLSPGVKYFWRVRGRNSGGWGGFSATGSFLTYPQTLALLATIPYPTFSSVTDYKPTDYRIVGLPGAGNTSAATLLGGAQNVDWDVYWDNGAANDYLVGYRGDSTFAFSVGRGFWVIHKGPLNVRTTVPSALLSVVREAEIPLHPGWNMITNPFPVAVPWDSVTHRSQVPGPIFGYTGSFTTSPVLQPYAGYYFFNGTNTQKLKVPYPTMGGTAVTVSDPALWRVTIKLAARGVVDSLTSFGVAEQSSDGLDELDVRKPRARGDIPTVDFRRVAWDPLYSSFASDIRKVSSSPKTWEFQVRSEPGVSARLSFCGLRRAPRDLSFYLISQEVGNPVDLRADSVFSFTPRQPVTDFNVVVGGEEQVRNIVEEHLPKSFVLENNFPNPFNPSTTIAISVPEYSDVSLRIYTLLGEQVRTLFDGPLERGRYWYTWDGRTGQGVDVASGVYIYRLTSRQGTVLARTMLLLK